MDTELLVKEISFSAVRSGGPGGQHANKVSSKVILQFNIEQSNALSDLEKITAKHKLSSKLTKEQALIITCDESRSQHKNKEIAINRFLSMMETAIKRPRKRIPTKVSKTVKRKRLETKKKMALKKSLRQKPKMD
jgi:ribosome-associated protein